MENSKQQVTSREDLNISFFSFCGIYTNVGKTDLVLLHGTHIVLTYSIT